MYTTPSTIAPPVSGLGGPVRAEFPTPQPRAVLCPYCGHTSLNPTQCEQCRGLFDPLSRQASQNSMGPWFIRDAANPFKPGCSFSTLRQMIRRGRVKGDTIIRGPLTRQFWAAARTVRSIANLLGECHACRAPVEASDAVCPRCGASFQPVTDREYLGLSPVHLLPGEAAPEAIAEASASASAAAAPGPLPSVPFTGAAVAGSAPAAQAFPLSPQVAEIAMVRLRRRAERLTSIVWVLGAALVVLIGVIALALAGPSIGIHLFTRDPLLGPHTPAATGMEPVPPPAAPAARPAKTPADAEPAAKPAQPDSAPEPAAAPALPDGSEAALPLPPEVAGLIEADTARSLADAAALLAGAADGSRGDAATRAAAVAYVERRRCMLAVQCRL